jgi:hypothetical protein
MSAPVRPLFLICEDGDEYLSRFRRFLGSELGFVRAASLAEAAAILAGSDGPRLVGLLLDLDFRRTPLEALVDEQGRALSPGAAGERARLARDQGILILRALRAEGHRLPAVLFADLDDPARAAFLSRSLAPLTVLDSRTGLPAVGALLRKLAGQGR